MFRKALTFVIFTLFIYAPVASSNMYAESSKTANSCSPSKLISDAEWHIYSKTRQKAFSQDTLDSYIVPVQKKSFSKLEAGHPIKNTMPISNTSDEPMLSAQQETQNNSSLDEPIKSAKNKRKFSIISEIPSIKPTLD